ANTPCPALRPSPSSNRGAPLLPPPADSWGRRPEAADVTPASEHFVELEYTVTADGQAENVRTVSSDVIGATERSVAAVMREARFRPRFVAGEPVSTKVPRVGALVDGR